MLGTSQFHKACVASSGYKQRREKDKFDGFFQPESAIHKSG
jgi:hypothetical protein